jgi:hypothetical protein
MRTLFICLGTLVFSSLNLAVAAPSPAQVQSSDSASCPTLSPLTTKQIEDVTKSKVVQSVVPLELSAGHPNDGTAGNALKFFHADTVDGRASGGEADLYSEAAVEKAAIEKIFPPQYVPASVRIELMPHTPQKYVVDVGTMSSSINYEILNTGPKGSATVSDHHALFAFPMAAKGASISITGGDANSGFVFCKVWLTPVN